MNYPQLDFTSITSLILQNDQNKTIADEHKPQIIDVRLNTYTYLLEIELTELSQLTMVSIHEKQFPDAILTEIVRDAQQRYESGNSLAYKNLMLKVIYLIQLTVRAVTKMSYEKRHNNGEDNKSQP